ncbi:hypothetical protein O6H91_Y558400 [Diphasiastrum complanatum]|nr:hypothetical protein O6H91_Y558400 [Diphasiastrum complanatum]KAJ7129921.1 hypothetical protein O6H91_Y558400 [Diphasiastrum complanatum]
MLFLADYQLRLSHHQVGLYSPYQLSHLESCKILEIGCSRVVQVGLPKRCKIHAISHSCVFSSYNSSFSSQGASKKCLRPEWSACPHHREQNGVFWADCTEHGSRNRGSGSRSIIGVASPALTFSPLREQKYESNEEDDFYVNVGYAIRTLREELPTLFYKELTFDIYRDDITFQDPLMTIGGIKNYRLLFWALRFHGRIFFKSLWIEILRVWQPSEKVIMVRWTMRGIPRVFWEAQGQYDGTSEYRLDKHGKIYEHRVTNVLPNSPPAYEAPSLLDLVGAVSGQTTPSPNFIERISFGLNAILPYLTKFSWVRYYWALTATLALNRDGDSFRSIVF